MMPITLQMGDAKLFEQLRELKEFQTLKEDIYKKIESYTSKEQLEKFIEHFY